MAPAREMDKPGKLMVAGLPKDDSFTEADLEKEFAPFGRITEVCVVKDIRKKTSRGYGFVTYENPKDANDAIKAMEGKNLGGVKPVHCEQATVGLNQQKKNEDVFKERGGGERGGRGGGFRGGRGGDRGGFRGETRGRGGERGGFRGEIRGRGGFRGEMGGFRRGEMGGGGEWDEFRGGRGGFRGGEMRGRGGERGGRRGFREDEMRGGFRGRRDGGGEFYEEEYGVEEYPQEDYGFEDLRGPALRPLLRDGPVRGARTGRKTLLPDPGSGGPSRGGYGVQPQYEGGEEFYEEEGGGGGRYEEYDERYNERGYGRGEEYDEYYEEDEYRQQERYEGGPSSRGRVRPVGRGGGEPPRRRALMDAPRRGGMEPSSHRQGAGEPPRRALMDTPLRRGGMPSRPRGGNLDYAEEEEGSFREAPALRREGRLYPGGRGGEGQVAGGRAHTQVEEEWRGGEDFGYSEEGHGFREGGDYFNDGYSSQRNLTESSRGRGAPRGRPAVGKGVQEPLPLQRRQALLGDDPFSSSAEPQREYYDRRPNTGADMRMREKYEEEEENGFNAPGYGRRPPPSAMARQAAAHPEERYRDGGPDIGIMRGGARGPRRIQPGERGRFEEEGFPEDSRPVMSRREGFGEERRPALMDRECDFDPRGSKRPVENMGRFSAENMTTFRRQYENIMEKAGPGPSAPKRDRYDGYY